MICERCHGKGRIIQKAKFWRGGKKFAELDEIGICPLCHGVGQIHCCDGDRADAMLSATEPNPNEAG